MRVSVLYTPLITAGGAERQVLEEVAHLKRRGHRVRLLTFHLAPDVLSVAGVDASDITVLTSRFGAAGQVIALRRALSRMRPDVLISHTSPELTWLATRGFGRPYIQYHNSPPFYIGTDENPYMASRRYRRAFPRVRADVAGYTELALTTVGWRAGIAAEARTFLKHHALRDARAVIAPSQRSVRELRLLHGIEATVVRGCLPSSLVADPPTTTSRDLDDESSPLVLSVCRLERVKRIDLLLHAFAKVREQIVNATLVIAGNGADLGRLRAIADSLGIEDNVEFMGYVPEDELWALYARADVLAAPAMADFNIAPYEALAMGRKVVWSDEMETDPEIEASGQVFIAAPDAESFARAILDALRAPAGRRANLRSMTWEARADRLETIAADAAHNGRIAA